MGTFLRHSVVVQTLLSFMSSYVCAHVSQLIYPSVTMFHLHKGHFQSSVIIGHRSTIQDATSLLSRVVIGGGGYIINVSAVEGQCVVFLIYILS